MTIRTPTTKPGKRGSFSVPFEPLFEALHEEGIEPTIAQMREFSRVVGFEEDWTWEKLESVALAFFGSDRASRKAISDTIQNLKERQRNTRDAEAIKLENKQEENEYAQSNRSNRLDGRFVFIAIVCLICAAVAFDRTETLGKLVDIWTVQPPPPDPDSDPDPGPDSGPDPNPGPDPGPGPDSGPEPEAGNDFPNVAFSVCAALALFCVFALAYILRCPIRPTAGSMKWTQPGGRFFVGKLGPPCDGFVSELGADKIADFFVDRTRSRETRRVDGSATVASTARNAGIPNIVWQSRTAQRQLLVIEDGGDPLRNILDTATRLHEMLERRGVQSDVATAFEKLEDAILGDGTSFRLSEWLADKSKIVVVAMNDRILRRSSSSLIQSLFTSHSTIWLDPSLTKSSPVARTFPDGMIRCPMTQDALIEALEALSGLRKLPVVSVNAIRNETDIDPYLQLGDVLPLAMACSQMQPISIKLVDHLRKTFFRPLVPHDVMRLANCSEVHATSSDLKFSSSFQQRLSADYKLRFSERDRKQIAELLLEEIQKGRPSDPNSFAYASWELNLRQIQIAVDPKKAIEGLARLSQTSLRPNLLQRLENTGAISGQGTPQTDGVGGPLVAALNQAQIGPFPLSRGTWGLLFAITATLASLSLLIMIGARL